MKKNRLIRKIFYITGTIILIITIAVGAFVYKNISDYRRFREEYNRKNNEKNLSDVPAVSGLSPEIRESIDLHNPALKTAETDLSNIVMNLDGPRYSEFENYIRAIKPAYLYEDLFGIEEALQKYNQIKFSVETHSGDILDSRGQIDVSKFEQRIIDNNKAYLENEKAKTGVIFYKEVGKKELEQICGIIAEVFRYHSDNKLIDVDRASCNLSSLKVFKDAQPDMAYVTKDNCLIINPDMVSVLKMMNPDLDAFRNTIIHETMHIFQCACIDMKNANEYQMNYGNCYSWEILKVNPIMWNWFIEASAEKNNSNYTGDRPSVYHQMIGYLESLSLSTILNDAVMVNQTERMTFNTGKIETLFEQFDSRNEQDQNEIIKMMYSIEIMQNDSPEFLELYKNKYGKELAGQDLDVLKHTIKNSILTTLTKAFYLNLAKKVSEGNIPLQDIFFLITVFENDINSHVKYTNDAQRFSYIQDFLKTYIEIQDNFFNALSESSNYDIDKILNAYDNYGLTVLKNGEKVPNYELDWLTQDKRDYILSREESLRDISTGNIRNSYMIMQETQINP